MKSTTVDTSCIIPKYPNLHFTWMKSRHDYSPWLFIGWKNLSENIILIKRNHKLNLEFFFKWRFPFSHMLRLFQDSFTFESNCFYATVTFSEQLHLQSICFFWGASFSEQSLFRSSYFLRETTFLERNFYRAASFWE